MTMEQLVERVREALRKEIEEYFTEDWGEHWEKDKADALAQLGRATRLRHMYRIVCRDQLAYDDESWVLFLVKAITGLSTEDLMHEIVLERHNT